MFSLEPESPVATASSLALILPLHMILLQHDPSHVRCGIRLATCYMRMGEFPDALGALRDLEAAGCDPEGGCWLLRRWVAVWGTCTLLGWQAAE